MNQQLQPASNDIEAHVEDVRSLLSATAHMAEEKVTEARKRVEAALDSGGKIVDHLEAYVVKGAGCTDKALRAHPYQVAAIALGVGVLIGHLATLPCSRSFR